MQFQMKIPKKSSMMERVADDLSRLIKKELNSICPEESMSTLLLETDSQIIDSKWEDGHIILTIKRNNNEFEFKLKPVSWGRK